jgi:capsular polysaccharide biosynthesis protein
LKAVNKEETMNGKNLIAVLHEDKKLLAILTGIICTFAAMLSLAITAGTYYL